MTARRFRHVGDTDSEQACCALLDRLAPLWEWIRQAVMRALTDTGRTIRVPVHMVATGRVLAVTLFASVNRDCMRCSWWGAARGSGCVRGASVGCKLLTHVSHAVNAAPSVRGVAELAAYRAQLLRHAQEAGATRGRRSPVGSTREVHREWLSS
jgi:hypothetical protein